MSEEHQAPPAANDVGAVLDKWFSDSFSGSVVARDTEVWNFVRGKVDELKERLKSRG